MRRNLSLSPLFGANCSRNARTCFQRLAQYKPLIGALLYRVEAQNAEVFVEVLAHDAGQELPEFWSASSLSFSPISSEKQQN